MLPYFKNLGDRIESLWLKRTYDEECFPQLVLEVLGDAPPHENVAIPDIVDWLFRPRHPFRQPVSPELFGQPPVALYQGPRFYIEALFWFSGTTAVHEHSFSGAFAVLAGSSVHSHWSFQATGSVNSRMVPGRLDRISTEILRPGGMRAIRSGDRLIHQLFHLEVPSVTVVVRTYVDRHQLPQYQYMLPGLAIDNDDRDATRIRRFLMLEAMAQGQVDGIARYARQMIEQSDAETVYHLFTLLGRRKLDPQLMDSLYESARERHGEVIDLFRDVCAWQKRERIVSGLRSKVTESGPRFLLALLMLMPDREAILDTIRLEYPDADPMAMIDSWLERMTKETIGFPFDAANRNLLHGLVEGCGMDGLIDRLSAEFRGSSVEEHHDKLVDHVKRIARSDLFYPLFSASPLRGMP